MDTECSHELGGNLGPAVNHHSNDRSQGGIKSLWVCFQGVLLKWLGEVLGRFGVGILQIFHTLMPLVVVVLVLDLVEKSHQSVHVNVDGKGLVFHDGSGYVCTRDDEDGEELKPHSYKCCWWIM